MADAVDRAGVVVGHQQRAVRRNQQPHGTPEGGCPILDEESGQEILEFAGLPVLVGTRRMTRVGRAVEKGETLGFMKVVANAETGKILGAAILGPGGDEAIHGILDAINVGTPYRALQWAVPIHPTVSELIPTVVLGLAAKD